MGEQRDGHDWIFIEALRIIRLFLSLSLSFPCDTIDKFLTVFIAQTQLYADNKYRRKFKRKMILEDTRVHGRKKV